MTIQEVAKKLKENKEAKFRYPELAEHLVLSLNQGSLLTGKLGCPTINGVYHNAALSLDELLREDWGEVFDLAEVSSKATPSTSESSGLQAEEPEEA